MFKSADENLAQQNQERPGIWKHWQHRAYETDWGRSKPESMNPEPEVESEEEREDD